RRSSTTGPRTARSQPSTRWTTSAGSAPPPSRTSGRSSRCRWRPGRGVGAVAYNRGVMPSPSAVVLLWGEDSFLLREAAAEVRQVAVARRELPQWLLARAERRSLALAPDGARALVEVLGEFPAALDGALDQLASAFGAGRVTRREVESQFRGLGEQRVWDLCDHLFERDLG